MKILRDYQKEAVEISLEKERGIVCLPTGSGKTAIQSQTLIEIFKKSPGFGVYMVLAPRIILSYQLMKEYYKELNENGIESWYCGLHSGRMDGDIKDFERLRNEDISFQHIISTTNSSVLSQEIEKARSRNLPILIFSTYHSAPRSQKAMGDALFKFVICDEAHYLVENQFESLVRPIEGLNSEKTIFYTATMKHSTSTEGKGMNNPERFGEVIYQKIPREIIEMGHMVRPRMHIVSFPDSDVNPEMLIQNAGKIIRECFMQHEYVSQRTGKILITCTGTPMMKSILKSTDLAQLQKRKGVKVYATASDDSIGNQIDGEKMGRQEFLRVLKEDGENPSIPMVVLHIDILTEGIDVPGITGILPFRNLRASKFIQTLGRASRICKEDQMSFLSGEYTHKDLGEMAKPYAWIMVPDVEGEDLRDEVGYMVGELRSYGFNPWEDVFISNDKGQMPPVVLLSPLVSPKKKNQFIFEVLEEIKHEIEDEEIAKLLEGKSIRELAETSKSGRL